MAYTPYEYERMQTLLETLEDRQDSISKAIGIAAQEGDLSENAEYHGQREQQGLDNARIDMLETKINQSTVIYLEDEPFYNNTPEDVSNLVKLGATLILRRWDGKIVYRTITGPDLATMYTLGLPPNPNPKDNNYQYEIENPYWDANSIGARVLNRPLNDEITPSLKERDKVYRLIGIDYKNDALAYYSAEKSGKNLKYPKVAELWLGNKKLTDDQKKSEADARKVGIKFIRDQALLRYKERKGLTTKSNPRKRKSVSRRRR